MTFTVTLGAAVQGGLTLTPGYTNGTAGSGDYTPNTAALTFTGTKGETQTFAVSTIDDAILESTETFTVGLTASNTSSGVNALDTGTGTITDNDGGAALTISDAGAEEGEAMTFNVSLNKAVQGGLTVTPVYANGTASDADYTANTAPMSFSGEANENRNFRVSTIEDALAEGAETFTVGLSISGTSLGVAADDTGTGTINDDDEAGAALTLSGARAEEGEGLTFTATLDQAVPGGFTATPAYADGTATAGADYAPNTAALSFAGAAGERHSFTVATMEDAEVEPDETFTVGLSIAAGDSGDAADAKRTSAEGARSKVASASAAGTIVNDDAYKIVVRAKVKLSADPDRLGEDADPVTVELTATADAAIPRARTVRVSVGGAGDSAAEGTDYAAVGDFDLTIAANAAKGMAEFELAPVNDDLVEGDETITISGSGADMEVQGTTITLVDDEAAPTVSLSLNPSSVSEGASGTQVTVTATFSNGGVYAEDKTVTVSVGGSGTATSGTDYAAVADFDITIAANAGSGAGTFDLAPQDDELVEGEETVGVAGAADGLTVHGAALTLADDDRATLTIDDASADEGGAMTFTVTLDKAVPGGLTATPGYTDGTATEGADYTANTAALSFAGEAGETESFTVSTTDDAALEGDETFTVGLAVSGTSLGVSAEDTGTGTIVDDDADAADRMLKLHEPILADVSLAMTESVVDAVSGRVERAGRGGASRRLDYAGGGGSGYGHGHGHGTPGAAGMAGTQSLGGPDGPGAPAWSPQADSAARWATPPAWRRRSAAPTRCRRSGRRAARRTAPACSKGTCPARWRRWAARGRRRPDSTAGAATRSANPCAGSSAACRSSIPWATPRTARTPAARRSGARATCAR